MGYDTGQFEGETPEELICSICTGVLARPVTTHCDHLFCSECIHDWLRENNTCPIDRTHLRPCMLKPAPRAIRNLINKLPIFCDFVEEGCTELMPLEGYPSHVSRCPFNPDRMVRCKYWCKQAMTQSALKTHNCVNELIETLNRQQYQLVQMTNERNMLAFALILMVILYFCLPAAAIFHLVPNLFGDT